MEGKLICVSVQLYVLPGFVSVHVNCSSLSVCMKYDTHTSSPSIWLFLPSSDYIPSVSASFSPPFPPSTDSSVILNTVRNMCYCVVSAELCNFDPCRNQNHLTLPRGWCHGGLTFTYPYFTVTHTHTHAHTPIKCRRFNTYLAHWNIAYKHTSPLEVASRAELFVISLIGQSTEKYQIQSKWEMNGEVEWLEKLGEFMYLVVKMSKRQLNLTCLLRQSTLHQCLWRRWSFVQSDQMNWDENEKNNNNKEQTLCMLMRKVRMQQQRSM